MKREVVAIPTAPRSRSGGICFLLFLALAAPPLPAQQSAAPWRLSYFPYLTATPNDGVMGIARAIWFRQADWGERVSLDNSVAVEAGYSTRDAWLARATWANPRLTDRWRIVAHAEAGHTPHFMDPDQSFAARHDRRVAWTDVTRNLTDRLRLAVRGGVRNDEIGLSAGEFSAERDETDVSVRLAAVYDLRDREFEVNNGALLEAGVITGSAGGGYTAPYAHVRGWVRPSLPLRLTARVGWRGTVSGGALAPSIEFPGWEQPFTILGGPHSHRGMPVAYRPVDGVLLAGAEARFDILNVGELGALTLLAFVDGGKDLWAEGDLVPLESPIAARAEAAWDTTEHWRWSGGGGVALRVLRAATLTVTASRGDGEMRWYVSSGWAW